MLNSYPLRVSKEVVFEMRSGRNRPLAKELSLPIAYRKIKYVPIDPLEGRCCAVVYGLEDFRKPLEQQVE